MLPFNLYAVSISAGHIHHILSSISLTAHHTKAPLIYIRRNIDNPFQIFSLIVSYPSVTSILGNISPKWDTHTILVKNRHVFKSSKSLFIEASSVWNIYINLFTQPPYILYLTTSFIDERISNCHFSCTHTHKVEAFSLSIHFATSGVPLLTDIRSNISHCPEPYTIASYLLLLTSHGFEIIAHSRLHAVAYLHP